MSLETLLPKDQTRAHLLIAATRIFSDRGFAKTSVRDITRTAGTNVAAVNYHFGGKAGLYREVVAECFRQAPPLDMTWMTDQEIALSARLTTFFTQLFERFSQRQGAALFHLLVREEVEPSGELGTLLGDLLEPQHTGMVAAFAVEIGCLPSDPRAHRLVKTFFDMVKGYCRHHEVLAQVAPAVFGGDDWQKAAIADLVEQAQDLLRGARWRVLRERMAAEPVSLSEFAPFISPSDAPN